MCPVHSARTFAFLTLIFVAGTVGLQVLQARSLPRFEQAVAQSPDGETFPVRIPLADGSRTGPVEYKIDATMRLGFPLHSVFHVIPDDCVTGLDVNGAAVPVQRASQASLCDWRNGLDIDLRGYVHPGYNKISIRVRNHDGPWGVQIRASRNDTAVAVLNAVFLLLLIPYLLVSMAALGILRSHRWSFWAAAGLVVVGALLRFAFIYLVHAPEDHVFSDMASYVDGAVQIVAGQRGPHHLFHPIGYPLALAASLWLTDGFSLAVLMQYLMSVAAFLLTWRGSVWFLGERRALLVLLVGALHFPFIALSGFFMAETGFSFVLSLLFYLLARRTFPWKPWYAFAIGAIYMAGAWLKGNNAMFGPVFIAWVAFGVWRNRTYLVPARWRSVAKASAAFTAGACLIALVTAVSTYALFGHARIAASVGALNFIEGKCPDKINADLGGSIWQSPLFVQLGEGGQKHWPAHFYDGAYFWKAGWGCIKNDPWVLVTSVRYVYYLFFDNQLWPVNASDYAGLNRWYGMFFSAVLFPGMMVGLVLVSRKPFSGRKAAFLPLVSVCLVSWLLKSEMRYRVPFDVVIIPLSVMGWTWLVGAVRLVPGSAVARFPRMVRRRSENTQSG